MDWAPPNIVVPRMVPQASTRTRYSMKHADATTLGMLVGRQVPRLARLKAVQAGTGSGHQQRTGARHYHCEHVRPSSSPRSSSSSLVPAAGIPRTYVVVVAWRFNFQCGRQNAYCHVPRITRVLAAGLPVPVSILVVYSSCVGWNTRQIQMMLIVL